MCLFVHVSVCKILRTSIRILMNIDIAEIYLLCRHMQVFVKMEQYRTLHEDLSALLRASLNTWRSENYFKQKF